MNVTPLIDVVLVLLIVFMVASPMLMRSTPVQVPPRADGTSVPARPALVVTLGLSGHVELNVGASQETLSVLDLPARLRALDLSSYDVFVDFHAEVPYRDAMAMSDAIRGVGVDDIRLVLH